MEIRIIKSPAQGTLDILLRRKGSGASIPIESVDAVGLVQGRMIETVSYTHLDVYKRQEIP